MMLKRSSVIMSQYLCARIGRSCRSRMDHHSCWDSVIKWRHHCLHHLMQDVRQSHPRHRNSDKEPVRGFQKHPVEHLQDHHHDLCNEGISWWGVNSFPVTWPSLSFLWNTKVRVLPTSRGASPRPTTADHRNTRVNC